MYSVNDLMKAGQYRKIVSNVLISTDLSYGHLVQIGRELSQTEGTQLICAMDSGFAVAVDWTELTFAIGSVNCGDASRCS
jgi:hypothetical protein